MVYVCSFTRRLSPNYIPALTNNTLGVILLDPACMYFSYPFTRHAQSNFTHNALAASGRMRFNSSALFTVAQTLIACVLIITLITVSVLICNVEYLLYSDQPLFVANVVSTT